MLKFSSTLTLLALTASVIPAQKTAEASGRAASEYNLAENALAIGGFDPVAYRLEGGGEPLRGKSSLEVRFQGVTYRFANEANRGAFLDDPQRYEPLYGGWCAWAMTKGKKVEVDPESFLVEEDRLLLFYDGWFNDTRKEWLEEGGVKLRPKADQSWRELSGEHGSSRPPSAWGKEVGLDGLDPVLHARDQLTSGKAAFTTRLGGTIYRFVGAKNRMVFLADPARFLPLYGGYGATTLAKGEQAKGDPRIYVRKNGRAVLFCDEAGRDAWRLDAAWASRADESWQSLLENQKAAR